MKRSAAAVLIGAELGASGAASSSLAEPVDGAVIDQIGAVSGEHGQIGDPITAEPQQRRLDLAYARMAGESLSVVDIGIGLAGPIDRSGQRAYAADQVARVTQIHCPGSLFSQRDERPQRSPSRQTLRAGARGGSTPRVRPVSFILSHPAAGHAARPCDVTTTTG